jgi:Fic family protein
MGGMLYFTTMDITDYKAGQYEPQYEYKSFLPTMVHHEWGLNDPKLIDLLGRADRALGELNACARFIPDIDFFIAMHVAKEATQSSRIEGTQTNIEESLKSIDDIDPDRRDDWTEVQNYINAINFAITELEHLPLSNRLLKQTHAKLMQGVRGKEKMPGEFRVSQNWIGVSLRNAIFVPPHHNHLPDLMSDLEKFINQQDIVTHPLLRIAIAHYQFETIHPFLDGNGRLGRLMISLFLADTGLLHKPALYLSDYFERNKTAYVDHLMAVRQADKMEEWLIFFLHGVEETARLSIDVFTGIIELRTRIERDVLPRFSARRQDNVQTLMRHLYSQPVIDVKAVINIIGVTSKTAAALVDDLVKYGILVEITGQRRNRLFAFQDYITFFRR